MGLNWNLYEIRCYIDYGLEYLEVIRLWYGDDIGSMGYLF